ncbi:1321_t:CDS:2, partial [Funneliformis caledonium]
KGKEREANPIPVYTHGSKIRSLAKVQSIVVGSSQNLHEDNVMIDVPAKKRRQRYDQFHDVDNTIIIPDEEPEQQVGLSDEFGEEEDSWSVDDELALDDDEPLFNDDEILIELFATPDVDSHQFEEFPSTAYMARKLLGIRKKSKTFATCLDCNKLYDIT